MSLDKQDATVGHACISPAERIGRLSRLLDEEITRQHFTSAPKRRVVTDDDGAVVIEWWSARRRARIGFSAEHDPEDDGWWAISHHQDDLPVTGRMSELDIQMLVAMMRRWEMPWWRRAWKWLRTSY